MSLVKRPQPNGQFKKQYQCCFCDKSYTTEPILAFHKKTSHPGEKPPQPKVPEKPPQLFKVSMEKPTPREQTN